jgi:hypothetical protein
VINEPLNGNRSHNIANVQPSLHVNLTLKMRERVLL